MTDNQAAKKYLSQFSYEAKRRIQQKLLVTFNDAEFTCEAASREAIRDERNYAYLDSHESPGLEHAVPVPYRTVEQTPPRMARGEQGGSSLNQPFSKQQKRAAAAKQVQQPKQDNHATAAAAQPHPSSSRRCCRCGDPNHLANACPQTDLQCHHCQSQGNAGRGHTDESCFILHPELRQIRRQKAAINHAASSIASPQSSSSASSEAITVDTVRAAASAAAMEAVDAAFARLRMQNADNAFVGCAFTAQANTATETATRPVRDRQLPTRFRDLSPTADHNRVGRPDVSRLPLGHDRLADSSDVASELNISEEDDIMVQFDVIALATERGRRRLAVLNSRRTIVPPTVVDSPAPVSSATLTTYRDAQKAMLQHFGVALDDPVEEVPRILFPVNVAQPTGGPRMRYEERMLVAPQVPYLDVSQRPLTLNGCAPLNVMVDTGAQPVILGAMFSAKLGLFGSKLKPSPCDIVSATGSIERVLGMSASPVEFQFHEANAGCITSLFVSVLVFKATDYDVLLGQDVLVPIGGDVLNWKGQLVYHPDFRTDGDREISIPFRKPKLTSALSFVAGCNLQAGAATFMPTYREPTALYDSDADAEEPISSPAPKHILPRLQSLQHSTDKLAITAARLYRHAVSSTNVSKPIGAVPQLLSFKSDLAAWIG